MPKIKVEIEVPNDKYCKNCIYCRRDEKGYCYLFNKELAVERFDWNWGKIDILRCDKCKQAEVKDESIQD